VNDGEWPKPSYATYIKDRLNGFGGTGNAFAFQDIEDYHADQGSLCLPIRAASIVRRRPPCNSAIQRGRTWRLRSKTPGAAVAAKKHAAAGPVMSAASPGVTGYFFRNDFIQTHESYLPALRRSAATRIRGDRKRAESCCRSTARISPWAAILSTPSLSLPSPRPDGAAHRDADRALVTFRRKRYACTYAGETTRGSSL